MASGQQPASLRVSILEGLIPGIRYGLDLLAEFESNSVWPEASLTITAQALRAGAKAEYHVFERRPSEVIKALEALAVDVKKLREQDKLRIIDSYTVQTRIGAPETPGASGLAPLTQSIKVSDWSIAVGREIKTGAEAEKGWIHIDDNTGVLLQYNDEKTIVDCWRTRITPHTKVAEAFAINSLLAGVASAAFYKQFESLFDGVIDFKSEETGGQIEHFVRVRFMRGRSYDSRWRHLHLLHNGEVTISD